MSDASHPSPQHNPALYGDAFADVYDAWYSHLGDDDFVDAVVRELPPHPAFILELGVGTGRLMSAVRTSRLPITDSCMGVDSSIKMLDVARSQHIDSFCTLHHMDFSTQIPTGPFNMIFVGYNTLFNLPNQQAIHDCMQLVSQSLASGGVFMVDLVIPHGEFPGEYDEMRTMANGDVVRSVSHHDPATQTISGYFTHIDDQAAGAQRPWFVQYLLPDQLDAIASSCGLILRHRWADGHKSPYTPDSSRHISTYVMT